MSKSQHGLVFILFMLITGCGGGSTVSEPEKVPITAVVMPLAISYAPVSFLGGRTTMFAVKENDIFATDNISNFFYSDQTGWQKQQKGIGSFIEAENFLISLSGYRSIDLGETWEALNTQEIHKLKYNKTNKLLYGVIDNNIMYSNDYATSWLNLLSSEADILDFIIADDTFVHFISLQDSSSFVTINVNTLAEYTTALPEPFYRLLNIDNSYYGLSSTGIYKSTDMGVTWTKASFLDEQAQLDVKLDLLTVENKVYVLGGYGAYLLDADFALKTVNLLSKHGAVNHIAFEGDNIFWSTNVGLFKANKNALFASDPEVSLIGRITSNSAKLLHYAGNDFNQVGDGNTLLADFSASSSTYLGLALLTAIITTSDNITLASFMSEFEQSAGGILKIDLAKNKVVSTLWGSDGLNLLNIGGRLLFHYETSFYYSDNNRILISDDDGLSWANFPVQSENREIKQIMYAEQCQQLVVIAANDDNNDVLTNDSKTIDPSSDNWQKEALDDNIIGMVTVGTSKVYWSKTSIWYQELCDSNYIQHKPSLLTGSEITTVNIINGDIWFATSNGELWQVEQGLFYKKKIADEAIMQVYMPLTGDMVVRTATNLFEIKLNTE